ncbi:hypothetical protein KALB_4849 [Kutzneria albida DSM 43870]|uniref:Uncharacterized protein n=1 Tax=Kutzneria albida DSM 43870 TaxID=1449976 RepID=W5WCG2_9PSEU|nr:hypothetical protein KALB_4849 [Kutzneria albida DSM 43870]
MNPIATRFEVCPRCQQGVTVNVYSSPPKTILRPVTATGRVPVETVVRLRTEPINHDCLDPGPGDGEPVMESAA